MSAPAAPPARSRRRRFGNLAALAVSLLLSLLLADWLAGLVLAARTRIPGPLRPGSFAYRNHEFHQRQTNGALGFRQAGFDPAPGARLVLLLGDSFVEGVGLDDEETLAARLNASFDRDSLRFFNGGWAGMDLRSYLEIHEVATRELPWRFDETILFLYLGNDVLDYAAVPEPEPRKRRRVLPNLRRLLKLYREGRERAQWFRVNDITPYVEWFEEYRGYYGRSTPLTAAERAEMTLRFLRIPAEIRAAMAVGLVNPSVFLRTIAPGMSDLPFDLDSDLDRRGFESTMVMLEDFLARARERVRVVLVPAKVQVSEEEREQARQIRGSAAAEEEPGDLLALNRAVRERLLRSLPPDRVMDLTDLILAEGWREFFYPIDGHFHPAGARRVAEEIARVLRAERDGRPASGAEGGH